MLGRNCVAKTRGAKTSFAWGGSPQEVLIFGPLVANPAGVAQKMMKPLKQARNLLIERTRPTLAVIAGRIEAAAREELGPVEREAAAFSQRFGCASPQPLPLIAALTVFATTTVTLAEKCVEPPKQFLRRFGIKL